MNYVSALIDDILLKLKDPSGVRGGISRLQVLRAMNRVYMMLNEDTKAVQRSWSIDFSAVGVNDSLEDGYFQLPDDFIYAWRVETTGGTKFNFRTKETFSDDIYYIFTIHSGRIHFSNVTEASTFTVKYYSSGYTLVSKEDGALSAGEINDPEYPRHLKDILIFATILDLDPEPAPAIYAIYENYRTKLERYTNVKDFSTPEMTGPLYVPTMGDIYERNY